MDEGPTAHWPNLILRLDKGLAAHWANLILQGQVGIMGPLHTRWALSLKRDEGPTAHRVNLLSQEG